MQHARKSTVLVLALLAGALSSMPAPREARPSDWPVERFVRNLEARLAADPADAGAHYTLGRVHAFAFALERTTLRGGGTEEYTWLKDLESQREAGPSEAPTPEQRLAHLERGVRHLREACRLEDTAMHRLTLAWLLETGAPAAKELDEPARVLGLEEEQPEDGEEVDPRALWVEHSITSYLRCLALVKEEGLDEDPMLRGPMGATIEREANEAVRRLIRARGVKGPEEEAFLAAADARGKELEARPPSRWITPVMFSLENGRTLADLTMPRARVPFDLDGDGVDAAGPWITPEAAWLVWDPHGRGEVVGGDRLLGSASGWLFFEDGYRVLDALDDDRDGCLRGAELDGLAAWHDRDTDGVSDAGEVVPLAALGVTGLATKATGSVGPSSTAPCGLELADGRRLPTWDWVLEVPEP